ncbi:hypothetical protein KEJ15_08745 [Candidatus Bathyarchaeota archaeon]|nr:hypothetical protein [Candidatus Bathyarchaeota archaeon]
MGIIKNKKAKKIDLLEMSDAEKQKVIARIKEVLQQKVAETKMWQSFFDAENLTINGNAIHCNENELRGLSFKADLLKTL